MLAIENTDVFLAWPRFRHPWPTNAACWSPSIWTFYTHDITVC